MQDKSFGESFFEPLTKLWAALTKPRQCPQLPDDAFVRLGVSRVLSQAKSGRDFLQSHAEAGALPVRVSNFFGTLTSERRLELCTEVNESLCLTVKTECRDPFATIEELAGFDLYTGDGHYIQAAAHDERINGTKQPVGNFYALDMRSGALRHFELGLSDKDTNRKREHDMHAIKRRGLAALRFGAKAKQKVMIVWDKACIDFSYWSKAKESGVYFLSREKEKMRLEVIKVLAFEKTLDCNKHVISDEVVVSSLGITLRRIVYHDIVGDVQYTYLTTNMKLPPGILVLLYKQRWGIEKVFDETENRFQEAKAWASSPTAKRIQSELICITHNLMLLADERLKVHDHIQNDPEIRRRAERQAQIEARLARKNQKLPYVFRVIDRITQRGVKLIRWIRNHIYNSISWNEALVALRRLYVRL